MAAVNSTYRYSDNVPNLEMRRTAPPEGRSRIPISQPGIMTKRESSRYKSAPSGAGQPSRLEMMQHDFQQKLLMEKEEKMINIYEQNQQQALRKVSGKERSESGGMVRDFFRERRAMEQNGQKGSISRDLHFKKKKQQREKELEMEEAKTQQMVEYQRKQALQQQAQYHQQQQQQYQQQQQQQHHQQPQQQYHQQPQQQYHQQPPQHIRQQRHQPQTPPNQQQAPTRTTKPLAPIKRQSSRGKPPSPDGVYETTDNFSDDMDHQSNEPSQRVLHRKAPAPAKQTLKPIGSKAKMGVQGRDPREQNGPQRKRVAIVPAQTKVAVVQRNAPSQQTNKKEKLTDFQKFQLEQDQERQDRLERHREKQKPRAVFAEEGDSSFEYDREKNEQRNAQKRRQKEYEDIKQKEAELKAMIAKHQLDLAGIQSSEEELNRSEEFWSAPPEQHHPHPPSQARRNNAVHVRRQSRIESVSPARSPAEERSSLKSQLTYRKESRAQQETQQSPETFHNKPVKVPLQRRQSQKRKPQATAPPPRRSPSPPTRNAEVSFYEQAVQDIEPNPELDLRGCPNCGRRFAADRITKHVNACKKTAAAAKKRKVFDTTKKRNEGTEAMQYVKRGEHLKDKTPAKKSNWRKKHEEFVRTVRDARTTQDYVNKGGNLADLPPPPPSENPDYVQCPWCSRRFAPSTAERHIPKCKDTKSRPRPPPKKNSKR